MLGGGELLFQQLAEGMVAKGHTVTVLTPRNFPDYKDQEIHNGVNIVRQWVPTFGQRHFFTFLALLKAIRLASQHDLVHAAIFNAIVPAWIASRLTGKIAILTVYEVWDTKWYSLSGQPRWKASLLRMIERALLLFRFDKVICISNSTLQDYLQLHPNVPAERIYPGVDYASFEGFRMTEVERQATRQEKGYLPNDFVILGFGRAGISKGFDYMVDAVPASAKAMPNARFVFIWPSAPNFISLRDSLIQRLESFHIPEQIQVLDKQTRVELFRFIQIADCIVIPSLAEGFGYAAVEACTMGQGVVTTTAGSIPEVVSQNVCLVKPASSTAITEGILAIYQKNNTVLPPKTFTNEAMLESHQNVYDQLLSGITKQK